jgi:tetratricopeptide (TPR) repeat protein
MKDGKHNEAEKDLAEAIKIKPDQATYMQRGDAYRSLKDYAHAVQDYARVIAYDGRNYEAYVARGISYGEMHKESDALKDFARALAINKAGAEAMIQRGSMLLANGHYRLAANDLEDAMRLCPHDVETQQKLAMAYTHLHKSFPKSWLHNTSLASAPERTSASSPIRTADSVVGSTTSSGIKMPRDTASLLSVGYKYLSTGEVEYATQMFAQAVKNEPNNSNARRYLAHALLQSGSSEGAVSQFNALVDLDALTPRDALAYSKALISAGRAERAADVLLQCVQSRPRDTQLRGALISTYARLGQASRAQACYTEGLRYAHSAAQKAELDAAYRGNSGSTTGTGSDFGG